MITDDSYDWRLDAWLCWQLAVRWMRKRGVVLRELDPIDDETERCLWYGGP